MLVVGFALAAHAQDWTTAPAPNGAGDLDQLGGVAVGEARVWVVGNTGDGSSLRGLARWWDGAAWTALPTPDLPLAYDRLLDVTETGPTQAWAIGYSANQSFSNSVSRSYAVRWDGTVFDRFLLDTPRPDDRLYGIDATGPDDVWAVGEAFGISSGEAVTFHFDGAAWTQVTPARAGRYSRLYDVDAGAPDDAWAVGAKFVRGNDHGYVLRWDGASWVEHAVPAETPYQDTLVAVSASGPDDAWAVGWVLDVIGFDEPQQTTALHWDGVAWTVVPTPDLSTFNNRLHDVVALAPDDAWAVGTWDDGFALRTLVMHWDGVAWTVVPSEDPGSYLNELSGVDGVDGDLWAVGQWSDGGVTVDPLVLRP